MNAKKNITNNQTKEEKVKKNYFKKYALYIAPFFVAAFFICSFFLLRNQAETKTLIDIRTVFEGETSNVTEANEEFIAFKDYYENDPKTIYYLLPKGDLSLFQNASTYNEGKSFTVSGKLTLIKDDDNASYWKLIDDISIQALVEYNGILSNLQIERDEYYSFKACSQEYSNCKYYLINVNNLPDEDQNFIDNLNENDEVKLSGKENELEGTAGSIYVELIEEIKIDLYSN